MDNATLQLCLGLLLTFLLGAQSQSDWTELNPSSPWSVRSDPQLAYLGGRLLLLGGHANNQYYNDVWSSGDGGRTWAQLPNAPWAPRSYHTAKTMGSFLYLLGGHDGNMWYNDVWRTADGSSWTQVTDRAPWKARAATALQVRQGKMYLMGGSDGLLAPIGNGTLFNDVWVSEDEGKSWVEATPAAPWPAREGLQKLTALYGPNETIILTAGEAGYSGPYFNDVWGTTNGVDWELMNKAADFTPRSGNLLLNVNGALFTFGGYGLPMKHDAYCLPPGNAAGRWKKLSDAPWKGRFDYDMEVLGGNITLLAGEASLFGAGGPYFNDVWQLAAPMC